MAKFRRLGDFEGQAGDEIFAKIASEIWAIFGCRVKLAILGEIWEIIGWNVRFLAYFAKKSYAKSADFGDF